MKAYYCHIIWHNLIVPGLRVYTSLSPRFYHRISTFDKWARTPGTSAGRLLHHPSSPTHTHRCVLFTTTHKMICCLHLHTHTHRCVLFTYKHTMTCRLHLNSQNDLLNSTTTKHTNICRLHLHTHKDVSYSPTHTKWFVVFTQQNLFVIFNNVNSLSSSLTHIDVVFTNIHATLCHPHQNKNWLIDFT